MSRRHKGGEVGTATAPPYRAWTLYKAKTHSELKEGLDLCEIGGWDVFTILDSGRREDHHDAQGRFYWTIVASRMVTP